MRRKQGRKGDRGNSRVRVKLEKANEASRGKEGRVQRDQEAREGGREG